jgi:ABC-type lipoprotein export system ATPase subunit
MLQKSLVMIEINNISKKYKKGPEEFTALVNVSFQIKKGDSVSVTGPSGAGKSTLLNAIGGLIRPDAGEILYNSKSIYAQKGKYLNAYRKRDVGFMFQQFNLMPYLTVLDNIKLACHQKSHAKAIDHYLEKCSLVEIKDKYPSQLSVGEKQRAAFIRAIISEPALLLADEPTGNLDPENSKILLSLVEEYHEKGGTVVLVSHDRVAAGYASHHIKIVKGRIL